MKKHKKVFGIFLGFCLCVNFAMNAVNVNANDDSSSYKKLTDEERQNSTYNPIYMGSDIDYQGNKLEIGEGPNGQIDNQAALDYQEQYNEGKVYKVTDRVYVANGFGLANSAMIIGDTGLIIIDTNDCIEASQKEYDAFREISDLPVKNIIYSHYHYTFGTQTYVNEDNKDEVKIYAHEDHSKDLGGAASEISSTYTYRNAIQQAGLLSFEGEDGAIGCGLGPFMTDPELEHHTSGYLPPTDLISRDGITEMEIDGVKIQFLPAESDCKDNMTIWLPEEKVCINNHVWPVYPNVYTLRGEVYRDPRIWIDGIDQIIGLNPEHMVAVHGKPFSGTQEEIKEILTTYRDGIQFLYDQTVRYINKGYSEDEVVQSVKLPEKYTNIEHMGEFYGEVESHIRGIYHGILGWYDGNVENLHPVTDEYEAEKLIEGFGGKDAVIEDSRLALEDKQYSWAAQLATYVLKTDPDNEEAKDIKVEALRQMAHATPASNTRNFYLTQMNELQDQMLEMKSNDISKDKLMGAPKDTFLKTLSVMVDPKKAGDNTMLLKFTFPDEDCSYGLQIQNGVGIMVEEPEKADAEITLNFDLLCDLICGNVSPVKTLISGDIEIDGLFNVLKFVSYLDI